VVPERAGRRAPCRVVQAQRDHGCVAGGEPFYMPAPGLFAHRDAYRRYTAYAANLEAAGLAERFPDYGDLRYVLIELLADRYPVGLARDYPFLIAQLVPEAEAIIARRAA
jgi:hypothetical protein